MSNPEPSSPQPPVDGPSSLVNVNDSNSAITGELVTALGDKLAPTEDAVPTLHDRGGSVALPAPMPSSPYGWLQNKWILALGAAGILAIPATYLAARNMEAQKAQVPVVATPPPKITAVAALGRLEPEGEVLKLTSSALQGVLVREVLVKEGDKVVPNQIIAILDSLGTKQAQLLKAQEEIRVAEANVAKVKAGAKTGDVSAQQAEVSRLQESLRGEVNTSKATLDRLQQQLLWETTAQSRRVEELKQDLIKGNAPYQAEQSRLKNLAQNAAIEYNRNQILHNGGAISASILDSKRLAWANAKEDLARNQAARQQTVAVLQEQIASNSATKNQINTTLNQQIKEATATYNRNLATLNQQIKQAQANVSSVSEVRAVDVRSAEAEVARAVATLRQAQADLQLAYVRAPIAGEVFKVHTKAGEAPGTKGIIELAQSDRMVAVAEVYESDIGRVKTGQVAEVKSETGSFAGTIKAVVTQVGLQVAKKDVLSTDPAADADARVVEVKLAIDPADVAKVRGLTNSKIEIKIKTE